MFAANLTRISLRFPHTHRRFCVDLEMKEAVLYLLNESTLSTYLDRIYDSVQ